MPWKRRTKARPSPCPKPAPVPKAITANPRSAHHGEYAYSCPLEIPIDVAARARAYSPVQIHDVWTVSNTDPRGSCSPGQDHRIRQRGRPDTLRHSYFCTGMCLDDSHRRHHMLPVA